MIHFMRGMLAACLCLCGSTLLAAGAQHTVELASSTAVLDEPLRAVLHLRPWNAAQLEYPVGCLQAEVRYGDFVVPAAQVQVSAVPMPEVGYVRVAVFSPLVVSEPLVYLRLTLSCEPQMEQQWTLFSEPEGALPAPKVAAPERVWKDSVAGMFAAAPAVPALSPPALDPAPARLVRAQRTALQQRPPAAPPGPAPQLRLDPADNAALAQAVRTLWQQHGQAQYESLHTEVAALREENEQLRARTQALLIRVEQLQPQQAGIAPAMRWQVSAAWVLHDLLPWGATLVLVAALAWFLHWLGSDRESPWRGEADMARARLRQALSRGSAPPERPPTAPSPRPPVAAALPASAAAVLTTATVEHTLPEDVQAQADEFIQAGHLGAVAVLLEAHLRTQAQKSAPVLLSLLDIYQDLGQTTQATRVGTLLSQLFNLRLANDTDPDLGLEDHPATLHSITAQWNQPSVCEVLKNLLLRPTAIEELSLTAFREVLALYEMAGLREASEPSFGLDWE